MASARDGAAPYIEFDRVEVMYSELVAGLRGVSLAIERGEFVFLCGPTGSGKSTLLKVLTREVLHTKGTVRLAGRDLGRVPTRDVPLLRREMGIVPQDFGLLPNKRVFENVGYAMRAVGRSKREVRSQVPEILDRVNMLHRIDAYPRELSGGEQQRVAIARALINNPPLLLADEPTGNLDPEHSIELMELLLRLNLRGTTVIVASHDMPIVERVNKRVIQLEFGRIVDDRTPTVDEPFVYTRESEMASEYGPASEEDEVPIDDDEFYEAEQLRAEEEGQEPDAGFDEESGPQEARSDA